MRKLLFSVLPALCVAGLFASSTMARSLHDVKNDVSSPVVAADSSSMILFYFEPKTSMFFYDKNEQAILKAGEMINRHRAEIEAGKLFVMVNGYCSSFRTEYSNYQMAKLRSSQVKSYYITNYGLKEENYITKIHTEPYNGDANVVAMFKLVPADSIETSEQAASDSREEASEEPVTEQSSVQPEPRPVEEQPAAPVEEKPEPEQPEPEVAVAPTEQPSASVVEPLQPLTPKPLWEDARWRIKTNIPFWALVVANVAAEYRFADHWSVDVPVYYSAWTTARTYRFRTFSVQPSVRYWLSPDWKGHFFGVHLTAGQFNIATNEKTRYQDADGMYGAGLDYGYALKFTENWGMEFNIGAGLIHTRYNAYYNIDNGECYDTRIKNYWGITRCGISIIYRIK